MKTKTFYLFLALILAFSNGTSAQKYNIIEKLLTQNNWTSCNAVYTRAENGKQYQMILALTDTSNLGRMCWYGTHFNANGTWKSEDQPMCGMPPYRASTISGTWDIVNGKVRMKVTNTHGSCRDENEEKCEAFYKRMKDMKGRVTYYEFEVINDKLIGGLLVKK
jgi:hypothetical protein